MCRGTKQAHGSPINGAERQTECPYILAACILRRPVDCNRAGRQSADRSQYHRGSNRRIFLRPDLRQRRGSSASTECCIARQKPNSTHGKVVRGARRIINSKSASPSGTLQSCRSSTSRPIAMSSRPKPPDIPPSRPAATQRLFRKHGMLHRQTKAKQHTRQGRERCKAHH